MHRPVPLKVQSNTNKIDVFMALESCQFIEKEQKKILIKVNKIKLWSLTSTH